VLEMQASPIRKLAPLADNAKKEGKKVYYLNRGQPDIHTPEKYFEDTNREYQARRDVVSKH
jgi:aspartate aminotransferase